MQPACRHHFGEQLAGTEEVLLAYDLIEAGGPDAIGKRLRGGLFLWEEAPGCGFAPHASTLSYEVLAASRCGNVVVSAYVAARILLRVIARSPKTVARAVAEL